MANWFTNFGESLVNGFTGHGFENNQDRANLDAQNEKKKKDLLAQQASAPVIRQQPTTTPNQPPALSLGALQTPTAPKPTQTITQMPVVQQPKPTPQPTVAAAPQAPSVVPQINNRPLALSSGLLDIPGSKPNPVAPSGLLVKPVPHAAPAPQPQQNGFQKFFGGIGGMIHDFTTDPNNVPRNVIDYITGQHNPLDGATLDYQHTVNGKPTLVPQAPPKDFNEAANRSLAGTILQKVLVDPFLQGTGKVADVAIQGGSLLGSIPNPFISKAQNDARQAQNLLNTQKLRDMLHGLTDTSGAPIVGTSGADQSGARIASGNASLGDFGNVGLEGLETGVSATAFDPANIINPVNKIRGAFGSGAAREGENVLANGAVENAANDVKPNLNQAPEVNPTVEPTVPTNINPENPLLLPENAAGAPRPNGVLTNNGPAGFVTKTPTQISDTEKAINLIKQIDTKTNVIRQGKTSTLTPDEARELIRQRNGLIDVVQGKQTLEDALKPPVNPADVTTGAPADVAPANGASVPGQPDLGTPGAVPTDGTIASNPTKNDIQDIVDNTVNPTVSKTTKAKLTPQDELGSVRQADVNNLTGELGVNENGQVYSKVSQAVDKDRAAKNLLGGKTPEEYLQTAKDTGEADSAELALLLQRTPQDSPIWGELASLKGKLATQKGQALALLERTMRETATPAQLASRTLQKANTAGFDTTGIADEINGVNKAFTDARDAYNKVVNNPESTNAEIQAAKNDFYRASKESFTNEGNILNKVAKTKEQKNLAYNLQKKSDVYLQGIGTSSLTSSPTSVLRNFAQGVGSLVHQAGLAPRVEAALNRRLGGSKIGSFDVQGAKTGFKTGASNLKSEIAARNAQLGLTKNPVSWLKHPISAIRQATTTGTELGNIPMEGAIRGGMSSEYKQILKSQGYKGEELNRLAERNTITDPLNIRAKYAKEINDLNGLSSEVDRTGGTFRGSLKTGFTKLGITDRTSDQLADFVDRDIFGFFKPTAIVAKKGADMATGGIAHLVPMISKLSRGDKEGAINELSKFISTGAVTLPTLGATGYALAKAGVLKQNDYGEWEIGDVPISGYLGAFAAPLAMGGIAGQNQHDGNPTFDGFAGKAYQTLVNAYPYGEVGQKLGSVGDVVGGLTSDVSGGQDAYGFKEGIADIVSGLAKENIPASAFLNTITKMLGGNVKDTNVDNPKDANSIQAGVAGLQEAGNKVIAGIPLVSNALSDKKNAFGDTIPKAPAIDSLLGASNPSIDQSNKDSGITAVGSKDLNKVANANLKSDSDKAAYNAAVKALQDNGDDVNNANVFKQLAKSGNYALAAKYDDKINQGIDDDEKTALAQFDGMDSDHQKVYLQDQKNAMNTYGAQLDNKKANGTLSDDDTDTTATWSGSGNSLMVKALVAKTNVDNNVPKTTLQLYKEVTTKKLYNSLNADQKAALDTYSDQLAAAGVQVRDFMSGGSGSGGSGSGKSAGDGIVLTKAVTSGSGSGGKFAHQNVDATIPQVIKPMPQYVIQQRKISVN